MTTTCALCSTEVENSGGGVFVTVDGCQAECPVGAPHGFDHVTASKAGWVSNGDVLPTADVARLIKGLPADLGR